MIIMQGVPADYHPEALSNLAPGSAVDAASVGLAAVYENVGTAAAAERAMTYTDDKGRKAIRNGAELFSTALPVLESAITKVGAAIGAVDRLIAGHEATIVKALAQAPTAINYAGELRQHYKSNKSPFTVLMTEAQAGDYAGVQAVLAAPPQLSGISRDQHAKLRAFVAALAAPEAFVQLEAAHTARARLVHATDYVTQYTQQKKRAWVGSTNALLDLNKLRKELTT